MEVQEGQDLNLTCFIVGTQEPWIPVFWDVNFDYEDDTHYNTSTCTLSITLALYNISSNDTGTYTCIVLEVAAPPDPKSIMVVVVPRPVGMFM